MVLSKKSPKGQTEANTRNSCNIAKLHCILIFPTHYYNEWDFSFPTLCKAKSHYLIFGIATWFIGY